MSPPVELNCVPFSCVSPLEIEVIFPLDVNDELLACVSLLSTLDDSILYCAETPAATLVLLAPDELDSLAPLDCVPVLVDAVAPKLACADTLALAPASAYKPTRASWDWLLLWNVWLSCTASSLMVAAL